MYVLVWLASDTCACEGQRITLGFVLSKSIYYLFGESLALVCLLIMLG